MLLATRTLREAYAPPGWPASVPPPDTDSWEPRAVGLVVGHLARGLPRTEASAPLSDRPGRDRSPSRGSVHRRSPGGVPRTIRAELHGWLPPSDIEAVLAVYRAEGTKQVATARALGLVVQALLNEG